MTLGGALGNPLGRMPAGGGGSTFIGQFFSAGVGAFAGTVPDGATHAFVEVLGGGATGHTGTGNGSGGGGAGNDAIVAVVAGGAVTGNVGEGSSTSKSFSATATTVTINGVTVTANSATSTANSYPGATGKYPGTAGQASEGTMPGKGGGRLAGNPHPTFSNIGGVHDVSPGCGGISFNGGWGGGSGLVCISYFSNADAALAFAKSVYGGVWTP